MMKHVLSTIESKRGTRNKFFLFLVKLKDATWFISRYLPRLIMVVLLYLLHVTPTYIAIRCRLYRRHTPKQYTISLCITCMDRVEHLKKTLRKNIDDNAAYPHLEFVLLDYNSQDGLQQWVFKHFKEELKSGRLVYYQTKKPKFFERARAKNIAHLVSTGDIVCNLDADNYTGRDFAFYINSRSQSNQKIIGFCQRSEVYNSTDFGFWGRIFMFKKYFIDLGGYDERFVGWGYEDDNLKFRAIRLGLLPDTIPFYFLKAILHDDILREKKIPISVKESLRTNAMVLKQCREQDIKVPNKTFDLNTEVYRIMP